jgi:methionyl aminopeptidase
MYAVGEVSKLAPRALELCRATYASLQAGMATVHSGSFLHAIGAAIEATVAPGHFSVVRDYVGHGLGRKFHEDPQVLHYQHFPALPTRLKNGVCLTIEPMINSGTHRTVLQPDGWTVLTADGGLSAQYEHSIAVTETGAEILTLSPRYGHALPLLV